MNPERVKVDIVYPNDPAGSKVGGVETFLKGFVKHAPADFDLRYVGISSDPSARPARRWREIRIGGRACSFYPVFIEEDENRKTRIPLSLRFTLHLALHPVDVSGSVLLFDRIEPAVLFRGSRQPKIGVVHNDIEKLVEKKSSEMLWGRFPGLYFLFEGMTFSTLDHVYTVSENTLKIYRSKYARMDGRFSFLPTWADPDVFYPKTEARAALRARLAGRGAPPPGKKWILFVGRLQKQKAPARFIDSFLEYRKTDPDSRLIIIGEGNLKDETKRHADALGLMDAACFLGNMEQTELADFYNASDVLLLTSNFEGMPRCALEALGCGLPVVTTDVGEVRKVVKNGFSGEVVPGFSPVDIAAALGRVLARPSEYSRARCAEAVSEYTPAKILGPVYALMAQLYRNARNIP